MSENLRKYTKSLYLLDAVAQRVPDDAWNQPSICDGWSARHVAGHAAWLIKNLGSIAAGDGFIAGEPEHLVLGDAPAEGMRAIVDTTLRQLDRPDSLAVTLPTPWGELSVDDFIGEVWLDPIVHAWDIADATGTAHGIDDAMALAALAQFEHMSNTHREAWELGAPITAPSDTAIDRLIASTGRSPSSSD